MPTASAGYLNRHVPVTHLSFPFPSLLPLPRTSTTKMAMELSAIFIYPVKACKALALERAAVGEAGFCWDRQWMVVDLRGRMQTQRVEPRLAMVQPRLPAEVLEGGEGSVTASNNLTLEAPGMEPVEVPLSQSASKAVPVSVWKWSGEAADEGGVPAEWLSRYLGKAVRLVRFDKGKGKRMTDPVWAAGYCAAFSDGFPFLVVTASSLVALNGRLGTPLPVSRFRPNLVVGGDGVEAFEEDSWRTFTVGEALFHGVKPCSRCKVTTTDQVTGVVGVEPLQTLRSFRAGRILAPARSELRNDVFFGMNAVCEQSLLHPAGFLVAVGDPVKVLEKNPEFAFKCG